MSHLNHLYSGVADCHLAVWHKSNKKTRWFHINQLVEAGSYMEATAANDDVYIGWGLQKEALGSNQRGSAKSVVIVPGFMFDADLKSDVPGVHAKCDLPETLEEVLESIEAIGFINPTAVRHSGNGAYLDWLLPAPAVFDTEAARCGFCFVSAVACGSYSRCKAGEGLEFRQHIGLGPDYPDAWDLEPQDQPAEGRDSRLIR